MGPDSHLVSVDLTPEDGGPSAEMEAEATHLCKGKWTLVRGRSTAFKTVDAVVEALGQQADVVFIDAEHTEPSAWSETMTYGPLLHKNGIMGYHDICFPELWTFWNKLRGRVPPNRSMEIISDVNQDSCGIGLILGRKLG
jgi:hypothetical protein